MKFAHRSLVFALAAALAACTTAPDTSDIAATHPMETKPSLLAYYWDLASANDAAGHPIAALQPAANRPLRLEFSGDRLAISGGCNRIGGAYAQTAAELQVDALMQTEMACVDRHLMELDAAISARLHGTLRSQLRSGNPPQLRLVASNGDTLMFQGTPTPQTRYGSAGTTVFFEVASERMPCSHPLIPNAQCLKVRERRYGDDGTLAWQGEWQPLYQEIEGYTHTPGMRNVLRVKKFELHQPPADAPSVAYVLDLVVESENVSP